jgi:hypothetical protein
MKLGVNVIALDPIQLYTYEFPSINNTNMEAVQTYDVRVTVVHLNAGFLVFSVHTDIRPPVLSFPSQNYLH